MVLVSPYSRKISIESRIRSTAIKCVEMLINVCINQNNPGTVYSMTLSIIVYNQ